MKNEIRYYLQLIKKSMNPMPETINAFNSEGERVLVEKPALEPFVPTHLITVVQLPTGAREVTINTANIEEKIDYILDAYDDEMILKTNPNISMCNILIV